MKKTLVLVLICLSFVLSSCSVTIPSSVEAKEKLEKLGYDVSLKTQFGSEVSDQGITQVTILKANLGDDYICAYFFANEEDTETFYKSREKAFTSADLSKKNKYSIYRGTQKAVDDFLS